MTLRAHNTGSPYLDELATVHDEIRARLWTRRYQEQVVVCPLPEPSPQPPQPPQPPPLPPRKIKSFEERIAEAEALKLPARIRTKVIRAIRESEMDCGGFVSEPVPCELPPEIALQGTPTIVHIQERVAFHFNLTRADILSKWRHTHVALPRQIAMYLSKLLTPRSLSEIGRRFGGRHHATVLHAVRKIAKMVETDAVFAEEISVLKEMLLS